MHKGENCNGEKASYQSLTADLEDKTPLKNYSSLLSPGTKMYHVVYMF